MIDIKVCLRVLSHLVCLPGPNPSSIAPSSPCPRWTAIILFYFGPNRSSFASSSQQLFTPLLSNDGAGEGGKMNNIALCTFIYLRFGPFVLFTKLQCIKHLRLSYECTANALKNAESEQKWDIQLSACSASVMLIRKVSETHTNPYFYQIRRHYYSGSLPWFGTIAFTSAANRTGVHLNRTPDHPF